MINAPVTIVEDQFQLAWIAALEQLLASHWELRNLVVHIRAPMLLDDCLHAKVEGFVGKHGLLGPKHVAYTIFPHGLYAKTASAMALFDAYNRRGGMFDRVKTGWGTYFRRMTCYDGHRGTEVNQLANIIGAIKTRQSLSRAAYTVVIQHPGGETVRPLGGPCLNYLAVQAEAAPSNGPPMVGLLAVYRNHDFLKRAYGNYWGLCNLLSFIAAEVGGCPGPLTCISSHAYVDAQKTAIKGFLEGVR